MDRPIAVVSDRSIHRLAEQIYLEMLLGDVASRMIVDGLTLQLAGYLVRNWSNLSGLPEHSRGGLAPWQVKRTCEAMMAALDGDPSLNELAAIADCSPTHFSRAFRQSMGVSPFRWLNERRIERAKELLAQGKMPLAEVALAVGYSAQSQFTTAFGRSTGLTPARWRRQSRP